MLLVAAGPTWRRCDVKIAQEQYEASLKFWNEATEMVHNVQPGNILDCYAVRISVYNGKLELCTTDENKVNILRQTGNIFYITLTCFNR